MLKLFNLANKCFENKCQGMCFQSLSHFMCFYFSALKNILYSEENTEKMLKSLDIEDTDGARRTISSA